MKQRRRVTLRQSFREMNEAEKGVVGYNDDFYVTAPLALWYWIAGVPDEPQQEAE
jgi:hypothetical protein